MDTARVANVVRDAGTWVNGDDPAWTLIDYKPGQFRDLPVFIRGEVTRPGAMVPPYNIMEGRFNLPIAIMEPGIFLSQPGTVINAS